MAPFKSPLSSKSSEAPDQSESNSSNILKKGKHQRKNANKKFRQQQNGSSDDTKPKQTAPIRLNARMRRLQREAEVKALESKTVVDFSPVQENLSCNWKLLQSVLEKEKPNNSYNKKEKNPEIVPNNKSKKKQKQHTKSPLSAAPSVPVEHEDIAAETEFTTALIDSLAKEKTTKNGKDVAWFKGVDPMLLDDDIAVDSDEADQDSESEGDPVEVDMDDVDSYFDSAKHKEEQRVVKKQAMKLNKRLEVPIAIDCEMVGVGMSESAVGRVSIVDKQGEVLYDKFVKPVEPVTDYRTKWSGIRPENLANATEFHQVQLEVANLMKKKLLVGHAIKNDLQGLMLSHPSHYIRDTSTYPPFRSRYGCTPSLKKLAKDFLGVNIQEGEHNSITDARATMQLYLSVRREWEDYLSSASRAGIKKLSQQLKLVNVSFGNRKKKKNRTVNGRVEKVKARNNFKKKKEVKNNKQKKSNNKMF